jgi:transcriptional regulator with XRE-family HTH domain
MVIGDRLKMFRETKNLSQGDIEKRTGLLRCYVSRVENGHTVPSVETLGDSQRFCTPQRSRLRLFPSVNPAA